MGETVFILAIILMVVGGFVWFIINLFKRLRSEPDQDHPDMKSKTKAYLWYFIGLFGILGFHRFYLGKTGTGFLYLFTLGVAGVGATIDLFTLGGQVERINTDIEMKELRSTTKAMADMGAERERRELDDMDNKETGLV
jgi:hypothetical protein